VAAAVGIEVLLVEGPMWCSGYGNWLFPDRKRFPRGLDPLIDYTHGKGMLFGLYVEPEGGRDGFTSSNRRPTCVRS
jgi:alpha-galactosidase